ncbi:hypothetical protein HYW99_02325 [Candidatus Woesearchaeota archaeon]|nr:hypothetical protein [Candidatus Woesearchaeota archaeon]
MNKKSQIQISETIAVLLVFFVLIFLGLIFYVKVFRSSADIEKEEFLQIKSIGIAQRVMYLPELQCAENNVIRENCVDILKLDIAKNLISQNELYYYDMLEFSDVKIDEIYPAQANYELYSRELPDFKNQFVTNVPISLYEPIERRYSFGVLTIKTQTK